MLKKFTDEYKDVKRIVLLSNGEVIGFASEESVKNYVTVLDLEDSEIEVLAVYEKREH